MFNFFKSGISIVVALMLMNSEAAFAGPATFIDKEREARLNDYHSPANSVRGMSAFTKDLTSDPSAQRVMDPNMFCRNASGNLISGCGVSAGNETSAWGGGQKKVRINYLPAHGMRSDMMYGVGMSNQVMTFLASSLNSIWTTFFYTDAGAAAGLGSAQSSADGAISAVKMQLDDIQNQIQRDPTISEVVASKLNGCVYNQLNGASAGNTADALANCFPDRLVSAGNFASSSMNGATLDQSADHPTGGSPNATTALNSIFQPVIKNPSLPLANGVANITSIEAQALFNDAKDWIGDVETIEVNSGTGATELSLERWRSPAPANDPKARFRSMLKVVWERVNFVLYQYCKYQDDLRNVNVSSHDPFPLTSLILPKNFWEYLNKSSFLFPYAFQDSDLVALTISGGFVPRAVMFDVLMAHFLKMQESNNAGATTGRALNCPELQTAPGQNGEFALLLSNNGSRLNEWRQIIFAVSFRIALGQYLNTLRVIRNTVLAFTGGLLAGGMYAPAQLALSMIAETAGLDNISYLEPAYRNNLQSLQGTLSELYAKYASELGQSAGGIAEMFQEAQESGHSSSSLSAMSGPAS